MCEGAHIVFEPYAVLVGGIAQTVVADEEDTGLGIGVLAEVVLVAVNLCPLAEEEQTAPAITGTLLGNVEMTPYKDVILEGIDVAVLECYHAVNCGIVGGMEVIVVAAVNDPAGLESAVDDVVKAAVHLEETVLSAEIVNMTAVANELTVNEGVSMTGLGNGGAPIDDRLAVLAVGAADIAVLGAGGFLILKEHGGRNVGCALSVILSGFGTMVVTAVPVCVPGLIADIVVGGGAGRGIGVAAELGVNLYLCAGEGGGGAVKEHYLAAVGLNGKIHGQYLIGLLVIGIHPDSTRMTVDSDYGSKLPGAGGDGDQCKLAGCGDNAGPADGNGGDVLVGCQGVGSLEALRHVHVIKMPCADVVEVQGHGDGLNVLNGCRNHVDVVQGAEQQAICVGRMGNYFDGCVLCGIYHKVTDDGGVVALLVADGELDLVTTVGESHVVERHFGAAAPYELGAVINAVDINLAGAGVYAGVVGLCGVIGNGSDEAYGVGGEGLSVQNHTLVHACHSVGNVAEDGSFPVIHGGGVVNGQIVNVEYVLAVHGGLIAVNIAVLAVLLADVELQESRAVLETVVGVGGNILGDIVPAGLIEGVNKADLSECGFACAGDVPLSGGVGAGGVAFSVERVDDKVDTQTVGFIGNVDPHTEGLCVFEYLRFARIECGELVTCLQRSGEIDLDRHGVVTAVNVAGGCIDYFRFAGSAGVVVVCGGAAVEAVQILILKVVNDLRALAEGNDGRGGDFGVVNESDGNVGGGSFHFLAYGGEAKTVQSTDGGVAERNLHVCSGDRNLECAVVCGDVEYHGSAVGNGDLGGIELKTVGDNDLDGNGADLLTVVVCGDGLCADSRACGVDAVGIGSVGDGEADALGGQLSGGTGGVNALDVDFNACAGGYVAVLRYHGYMIKNAGGSSLGSNYNAVDGGTGGAVGGDAAKGVIAFALTLCKDLGGAAAVAVDSPFAAESKHDLAEFIGAQTHGVGSVAAFGLNDNQSAVLLDTDHGTVGCVVAAAGGVHKLTVFYNEAEVAGNRLPLIAVKILGGGTKLEADGVVSVFGDRQIGLGVAVKCGGCKNLTVPYHEAAGRFAVVCQSGVHAADYVVAEFITVVVHLDFHGLCGPVGGVRQILVDAVIRRKDLNVGVVGVNLDHVQHLTAVAVVVVEHDFGFRGAVAKDIILFGQNGVVAAGDSGVKIRQCAHGEQTHEHHEAQQGYRDPAETLLVSHLFSLLFYFF